MQRSLEDAADDVDVEPILIGAAAEVAYAQLRRIFADKGIDDISARKRFANELYRWTGFGTIDLNALTQDGGTMRTTNSHYAMGWVLLTTVHLTGLTFERSRKRRQVLEKSIDVVSHNTMLAFITHAVLRRARSSRFAIEYPPIHPRVTPSTRPT